MEFFTREDIYSRLEGYCSTIYVDSEIIVIGASSIIINVGVGRGTHDIDIIAKTYSNAHTLYDIDIVSEGILFLCADYRDRLIYHGKFSRVDVYALHPLDVALIKLGRGYKKDIDDSINIIQSGLVNIDDFINKYRDFRNSYGGSYTKIDDGFFAVTGIRITPDERMF
jgi:hypothetical protein